MRLLGFRFPLEGQIWSQISEIATLSEICFTQEVLAGVREAQLRIAYSLLKPAIRAAASFRIPIRPLLDLLRLAYYEHLHRQGMSTEQIAAQFGQTSRHMRSLAQRLESAFFDAERDVGLGREVEAFAATPRTIDELVTQLPAWTPEQVRAAVERLIGERRLERDDDGTLRASQRYVVLRDEQFHHRIDSLNHFLDAAYRAVQQRLVRDDRKRGLMKTLSFSATEDDLRAWVERLEGDLRRDLAAIDEAAEFAGRAGERYTVCFGLAPKGDEP